MNLSISFVGKYLPNYQATYLRGNDQLYPPIQEGMATYTLIL